MDEPKVMLGWRSAKAAREAYLSSDYQRGWHGDGTVTGMTMDQFKRWLIDGDTTKRVAPGDREVCQAGRAFGDLPCRIYARIPNWPEFKEWFKGSKVTGFRNR